MKSFIISAIAGLFLFSASAFADCQYSDGTWAPEGTKSADNKICRNGEWDLGMNPQDFGFYELSDDGILSDNPREGVEPFIRVAHSLPR